MIFTTAGRNVMEKKGGGEREEAQRGTFQEEGERKQATEEKRKISETERGGVRRRKRR